jgi:competence protein ComEC
MVELYDLAGIAPKYLPEPHSNLLNGMLFGISLKNTGDFYDKTISAGLVHLVVVSGTNVTLLANFILSLLFLFPKKIAILTSVVSIVSFMMLIGIQPPVFRATLMSSIMLLGLLTGNKHHTLYTLFLTAYISILIYPEWVSSLSFYLTYLSTSGMILFTKPLNYTAVIVSPFMKVYHYIKAEVWTSIAAQIFILPVLYFAFGRISLISVVTNLLVSWSILPIMILGFCLVLFNSINTSVANLITFFLYPMLDYIVKVVELFS